MSKAKTIKSTPLPSNNKSNNPSVFDLQINELHTKIFHLRRTNNEIRKLHMNDKDCVDALNENIIVIDKYIGIMYQYLITWYKLNNNTQHPLYKMYQKDFNILKKMNQQKNINNNYNNSNQTPLKEFDLDYVAKQLKIKQKSKQNNEQKQDIQPNFQQKRVTNKNKSKKKSNKKGNNKSKSKSNKKTSNKPTGMSMDDDGGLFL